jgi:hypothetical protein
MLDLDMSNPKGTRIIERIKALIMPNPASNPRFLIAGIVLTPREPKPTAVVIEVKRHGSPARWYVSSSALLLSLNRGSSNR